MRSSDAYGHVQVQNSKTEAIVSVTFRHPQVKQEVIPQEWGFGFRLLE